MRNLEKTKASLDKLKINMGRFCFCNSILVTRISSSRFCIQ